MTGIFQKACPACATLVQLDVPSCDCGYTFHDNPEIADAAQQATDEELFESYLVARLDQALSALEDARTQLSGASGNYDKAYQVMRRVHELNSLQAELAAQKAKSAAARERIQQLTGTGAPADVFRAQQAERADSIASQASADKCPVCRAPMSSGALRCDCGYRAEVSLTNSTSANAASTQVKRNH